MTTAQPGEPPRVVGVCTLTTRWLAGELRDAPGVVAAAPLMTANLGIEELVRSVLRADTIRVLVVCGRDSRLFRPGQSLLALASNGVRESDGRIVGARGHRPYLRGLAVADVQNFRSRVTVVDSRDTLDPAVLRAHVAAHARGLPAAAEHGGPAPAPAPTVKPAFAPTVKPAFAPLRPGGRRQPILTAGEGFFVVHTDAVRRELLVRHYLDDCTPAHEMRGHRTESMVLGLIDAGLIRTPGHAAYLGAELAKAETALRLGLDYVQDLPLRRGIERNKGSGVSNTYHSLYRRPDRRPRRRAGRGPSTRRTGRAELAPGDGARHRPRAGVRGRAARQHRPAPGQPHGT